MNKSKIEWCDMTWNPVTGCYHGCEYCYARKIANRFDGNFAITNPTTGDFLISDFASECIVSPKLNDKSGAFMVQKQPIFNLKPENKTRLPYPFGFCPTFHRSRLNEPSLKTKPQTIFVCSMADLFGDWVPDEWIEAVFDACKKAPQHRYLFLTKNPKGLTEWKKQNSKAWCNLQNAFGFYADTPWYGVSVIDSLSINRILDLPRVCNKFISIEPLLQPLIIKELKYALGNQFVDWVIIGAETGNRKDKVVPKAEWITEITDECDRQKIPVFMKNSLVPVVGEVNMRREFPW